MRALSIVFRDRNPKTLRFRAAARRRSFFQIVALTSGPRLPHAVAATAAVLAIICLSVVPR